ncbi:MAG: arginine decarboxylase, pyruvoyl-dependent [Gemmatimonadetes bacterium]|nr:arginine decarboxylase, pyruvoyl-dependent [Gemmatimonadota bacterium]
MVFTTEQFVPTKVFLTKGIGIHREKLTSFEMSLRDARIARYNLVRVSSIFPPGCEVVPREDGLELLRPGQIAFTVLSEAATNEPSRRVAASVGLAIPTDVRHYGYISEHHAFGQAEQTAGDYAEDLAASMLATVLGIPFNPEEAWDVRREQWKLGGEIVDTVNVTAVEEGPEDGCWVTVVAAAVFCG